MAAHPYSFAASLPATPPGPSPRLQVVELQELVDAQLVAAGQGGSPLRKAWRRRRVTEILGEADTFVAQVGTLCGGGSNEVGAVQHRQGSSLIMLYHCCWHPHLPTHPPRPPAHPPTHPLHAPQLAPVYDHVSPCFPPDYRIFGVICAEHHRQLASMIDFIGLCADNLANSDILKVCARGSGGGAQIARAAAWAVVGVEGWLENGGCLAPTQPLLIAPACPCSLPCPALPYKRR